MAGPAVEVIRARPDDLPDVQALWREIAREVEPDDPAAPVREVEGLSRSLERFDFLRSDSFWLYIARLGETPIGYLTAIRIAKPDGRIGVLYIDELHVLRAHRRRGAGSALLQEVLETGRELGLWRVRLHADPGDAGVRAFYEANGFRQGGSGLFQTRVSAGEGTGSA